jgi:flagellar biosynthesis/type III secretory pathway protein FliH
MIEPLSFFFLLIVCILGTYALTPAIKRFEAHQRGYNKGHAEGHEEGFYEGFQEGLTDGIRIGEGRLKKAQHIDIKG